MSALPLWIIYFGASDMPVDVYRVRRCLVLGVTINHDKECSDYASLEAARAPLIERGLVNIHRHPSDEPHIVECWI